MALLQYGFWFSGMAESDVTRGQVAMLPAPTWTGVRRDPTMTGTGTIMSAHTQVADAAWRVFEWFHGQEPSVDRAQSGWGLPALKSQYRLIPSTGAFRQQALKVVQGELDLNTSPLQFNPFLNDFAVYDIWSRNLDQALRGSLTFDKLLSSVETEVNQEIKDGIERIAS